jgi:LysM repeat protein
MDRLEELKQKYQPVLSVMQQKQVQLTHLHVQENKLFIGGVTGSQDLKNDVWNTIKAVDPKYEDLIADISVDPSRAPAVPAAPVQPAVQTYTVQPGDSLSKISKHFYGDANQYMKIFQANRDQLDDPDRIGVGQVLKIPR